MSKEVKESTWIGRSLENYKKLHEKGAKLKGCNEALQAAKSLTIARRIVFGYKKKNVTK